MLVVGCGVAPQPAAADPPATTPSAEVRAEPNLVAQASGAPAERSVPGPEERAKLIGWWLRHDQSYMMVLDAIGEDGGVEARYLNPKPVHVSKAEIWIEEDSLRLLLELTDRNYPGNYYELAYQPDRDMWIGLYHHLGNGETFEVYFTRFDDEEPSAPNQR